LDHDFGGLHDHADRIALLQASSSALVRVMSFDEIVATFTTTCAMMVPSDAFHEREADCG